MTDFFKQIDEAAEAVSLDGAALTVERKVLFAALKKVSAAVPKRSVLPILKCVCFEMTTDGATITASNLEMRISVKLDGAAWAEPVKFCVPYAKLYRAVMCFRSRTVGLFPTINPNCVTIRGGLSSLTMAAPDPADFPPGKVELDLSIRNVIHDTEKFLRDLELASKSASTDDPRYYLTAVYLTTEGPRLRLTATDGKRLISLESSSVKGDNIAPVLLPARFVAPIRAAFAGGRAGGVAMDRYDSSLEFCDGTTSVSVKTIDSSGFPAYRQVLPRPEEIRGRFSFSAFALQWAIQSGAICAGSSGMIELTLSPGWMTIQGVDDENNTSKTTVPIAADALTLPPGMGQINLLFSFNNLLYACRIGEQVEMKFIEEFRPVLFETADCVCCIMPMRKK